jgi:hypothetical protein
MRRTAASAYFTWQMVVSDNLTRQHGAIQMKTADGSLKLFPLIDKSDVTENFADTIGNNYGWMGAVYYKVILTKYGDRNYYTLLGYDENNIRTNRKVIEVLKFNDGQPVFGSRIFNAPGNSIKASNPARYVMEYKKDAGPRLTYDESLNMIIMEHLVSETNEPNKKWTLIGDGDYEGFKWMEGRWVYVSKIFNEMTRMGKHLCLCHCGTTREILMTQNSRKINHPVSAPPETLPAVLPHYRSVSFVSYLLSVFRAVYVYG